jgi:site-specific DNA-cytosine methylase
MSRIILDLCGGSGAWSRPYLEARYDVRTIDLPTDVRLLKIFDAPIHGILAAPPCTRFSYARNRFPAGADELRDALSIVDACIRIAVVSKPVWWALENPLNLLRHYLGKPAWAFRQYEYGDTADKPTGLWGNFNPPMKTGSKKDRTKKSTWKTSVPNANPKDAITPPGFAKAFFEANP